MTKVPPPERFDDFSGKPFEEIIQKASTGLPDRMKPDGYFDFSQQTQQEGLLAKVLEKAGDAVLSYAEVRKLLFGTIRDEMTQNLESFKLPFSALVAAISDQALLMNIPAIGAGITSSMMLILAPLLVEGAIATISKVLLPDALIPVTKKEKAVESFLGSLIGLQIQMSAGAEMRVLIPVQNKVTAALMIKEMEKAKEEFATLFTVAEREGLDTSPIALFRNAPDQALAFLQNLHSGEDVYTLSLLGVWAVNRHIVEAALLKHPYEELRTRYQNVKEAFDLKTEATEEQNRQLTLLAQLIGYPPLLANYTTIRQVLDELEGSLEDYRVKKMAEERQVLFQAALEIKQIAFGKANAEYPYVGVMHTQLEYLSKTIMRMLPKSSDELSMQQMQALSQEIQSGFEEIKSENPHSLTMILKSHPRVFLYFLYINSPLLHEMSMPALVAPEEKHVEGFHGLIQKLSKWKAFSRYQPGALHTLLHELAKQAETKLAKLTFRVVYKAILEMISSLETDEAGPLFQTLTSIFSEPLA